MRFKISLRVYKETFGNKLPISYQYELSAWIYGVIAKSDSLYAAWLHNNGFVNDYKRFKMFVYSNLFPQFKVIDDRLAIQSDTMFMFLSFLPEKSTEEFVKGIFSENTFALGDKKSKVQFQVESIEVLPLPSFNDCEFQTLSPVVVSAKRDDGSIEYVSPEREDYGRMLINNLKGKYRAFYGKAFDGNDSLEFNLLSPVKSRLITIKANTSEMTKVKGYHYCFKLNTNEALLQLMYEVGLGEKNSTGFGMIEKTKN